MFCIGGSLIWAGGNREVGLVTLVFFGACLATAVVTLRRKLRASRFSAETVHVAGSTDIRTARGPLYAVAFGLIVVGAVMTFVATSYPWLFRALGAFVGVVGLVLFVVVALGLFGRRYVRFEPPGLVVGGIGYEITIPWDGIARVAEIEFASNAMIGLDLIDPQTVDVRPEHRRAKFYKDCARSRSWQDVDVALMPSQFGLDAPPFVAAVIRYVSDPAARDELAAAAPIVEARRLR